MQASSTSGSVRFRRILRQAHRWIGLVVALQLVLWVLGGFIMSVLRLDEVRGDDRVAPRAAPSLARGVALLPPAAVLRPEEFADVSRLTLTTLLGRPVYRVQGTHATVLVDAVTGDRLSPLPRETAEALARADYLGEAPIAGVDWVEAPIMEIRGRTLPLWRVRIADDRGTALYVSPQTGEVVARRNDLWRVFDFVWMLHIMDYETRDDFNHPLLVTTAATALLFLLTGLAMLVVSFRPRRT